MTEEMVFKRFLKTVSDDADVTFSGRVFHSRAAATGKARSPMVETLGDTCDRKASTTLQHQT